MFFLLFCLQVEKKMILKTTFVYSCNLMMINAFDVICFVSMNNDSGVIDWYPRESKNI